MLCLVIESSGRRRTVPLKDGQLTIGSSATNDVVLESEYVSRRHAVIRLANGGVEFEDLGSRNGTLVNGMRMVAGRVEPPSIIEFAPDVRASLVTADSEEVLLFPGGLSSHSNAAPLVRRREPLPVEQATHPASTSHPSLRERLEGKDKPAAPAARRAFRLEQGDRVVVECQSSLIRELHERMAGATTSDLNILLIGDTGVGKEIYANALHRQSARRSRPFRAVNACAIPESLLESLLFGAEDGVATGVRRQKGLIREADGGTFFLDEIGDMSPGMQAKLLRVIEERAVLPLGGCAPLTVDVRFIAATHRDLRAEIQAGRFREDLYQRLRGHEYRIPSLAEHAEDIPLYANAFLRDEANKAGRDIGGITVKAMKCLMEHQWRGNVRELETTIRRLVHELPDDGRPIGHADLPQELAGLAPGRATDLEDRLDAYRRRIVHETLLACGWNKSESARRLGIGRVRLRELMRRLKIEDSTGAEDDET